MTRSGFLLILLICVLSSAARADYRPGEVLVKYKPGLRVQALGKIAAVGGRVTRSLDQIRMQRVKLPPGMSVDDAIKRFQKDPNVECVVPNRIVRVCGTPNDQIFVYGYEHWMYGLVTQWGLDDPVASIDVVDAWDIEIGSPDVIIAVIDSGVDSTHEDFPAKIVPGINVLPGADPNNTEDDLGHGTMVAGIAAAKTNNGIGIAGVSWGSMIMPVKVIDSNGVGDDAVAAEGIIWAADNGAKIINMSFGSYEHVQALQDAVEYAWNKGCILVGGSGNDGIAAPFYPAYFEQVMSVGASNQQMGRCTADDWLVGGSNYGSYLDVMAPGAAIVSASPSLGGFGDAYDVSDGTSLATPFVSGVAALVWSHYPTWNSAEVVNQIESTCKDMETPGWDKYTGWGLVSAYRALTIPPAPGLSIGELSSIGSGQFVKVSNAVITSGSADMSDRLYVEQQDRACGTMLPFTNPPSGYVEGDIVEITGTVMTVNGERAIQNAMLSKKTSITPLKPLAMSGKSVGGGRLVYKSGVTNGVGTNNIGLLVTVYGRVTAPPGWTYFYIDDGSGLLDSSGFTGLKVICWGLSKPPQGSYVRVTGISSCERPVGTDLYIPVIRGRRQSDIQPLL